MEPRASWIVALLAVTLTAVPALAQQQPRQPAAQPAPRTAQPAQPAQPAQASQNDPSAAIRVKIAVIDIDLIRRDAAAVKDVNTQMESFERAVVAELQKEDDALRAADQELSRQRTILAPDAFNEKRRELGQRVADAQRKAQQKRQDLNQTYNEAMNEVQKTLNAIIFEVAQENALTLILRKDQTVMVAKPLEITETVLERMDKKLPKLRVADPNKPAPRAAPAQPPAARSGR